MSPPHKAVFDCNVFLQAMLSSRGAAHACWQKVIAGEVRLYVSAFVLSEVRRLPEHRSLQRYRNLTSERVERFAEEVLEAAELVEAPPDEFSLARDPDDAHYVNLALATGAHLVVSHDKDLLDLMNDDSSDGRSLRAHYPQFRIVTPRQLLAEL